MLFPKLLHFVVGFFILTVSANSGLAEYNGLHMPILFPCHLQEPAFISGVIEKGETKIKNKKQKHT